jgi:glycosyltransferase involved in cell wall biosynthesis
MQTVLHIITGLGLGGAESELYRMVVADKSRRHQVISLTDGGVFQADIEAAGIQVDTLNMPRSRLTLKGLAKLYRLVKSVDPDIVQTWMYHADLVGGVVARVASRAHIFWGIHNSETDSEGTPWQTRFVIWLCAKLSYVVPDAAISCSEAGRGVHVALGYQPKKLTVVHNGYDFSQFSPNADARAQLRAEWSVTEDDILFGMVGRWHPQKDHANLLQALHLLSQNGVTNWRCVLVGPDVDGDNAALVKIVADYGLADKVLLLGPRDDIPSVMNAIDLKILPSAFGEAFPNVLVEAMACGTPCVTTDIGDAAVIVGGIGYVVPASDPVALSGAIQEAVADKADPDVWARKADGGRRRVNDHYSLAAMIEAYAAVWKNAV